MNKKTATTILTSGIFISVLIGIGLISTSASAQSFSCAKAAVPSEMAICNNEELLVKDEQMANLFAEALVTASKSNEIGKVSQQQSQWLRRRNGCYIDFQCLETLYDERIRTLQTNS